MRRNLRLRNAPGKSREVVRASRHFLRRPFLRHLHTEHSSSRPASVTFLSKHSEEALMCSAFIRSTVLVASTLLLGFSTQPAWAEFQFETIALTGNTAPGSGGSGADVPFFDFKEDVVLNAVGEVAFSAETSPNVDSADRGIFSTVGGSLNTVVFEGQTAPGSGGSGSDVPFIAFTPPSLNSTGEIAFTALTESNADGNLIGIFSTVDGILDAVTFQGDIAPGSGGSGADVPFLLSAVEVPLNDSGDVVFRAATMQNVDGHSTGYFKTTGGTLQAVAFEGQIAAGSGGSGTDVPFRKLSLISTRPVINAAGEVTFGALTITNVDGGSRGIFSTVGGSLNALAFEGQTAPGSGGSGADVPFEDFGAPVINAAGEVVFRADTEENDDFNERGIFSTTGGTLHAVVFEGQIAPGSGGSGVDMPFSSFSIQDPALNAAGEIAFPADTHPNIDGGGSGIFSTAGGTLHAVAFEQQIAPGSGGSGADVPFTDFFVNQGFRSQSPDLNSLGELAFWAETSPNVDGGDRGIFSTVGGSLHVVVFEGDQIEVAPGVFRTIEELPVLTTDLFNDSGQVAFQAIFTDGSEGIFLSTPVPEPTTIALAGVVACYLCTSRKRPTRCP